MGEDDALGPVRDVLGSYAALAGDNYGRITLDDVSGHWCRIRSAMSEVCRVGPGAGLRNEDARQLRAHAERYCAGYDFGPELETLGGLYAEDAARVRAIGLKIASSLEEKGLIALFGDAARG